MSLIGKFRARWRQGIDLAIVIRALQDFLNVPVAIFFLTASDHVDPAYGMTRWRLMRMGWRFFLNNLRTPSLSAYQAHLVMGMKLLELPPDVKGCVVECGCYKGAMSVNLSIVCKIVGRTLKVYDSFEGLPPPTKHDSAWPADVAYMPEILAGSLAEVAANIKAFGALEVCEFRKGFFKDTLPSHVEPIALIVADVDFHSSLYDVVTNLWPHLVDRGFFFLDEYVLTDYCALFFSERFWKTRFDCAPPGLIGLGAGVQVGAYYVGPWREQSRLHAPRSIAYTRKGDRALWEYYPEDEPEAS